MGIMPEMLQHQKQQGKTTSCIIGRSPTGNAVVSFGDIEQAMRWVAMGKPHRIKFFKQTTIEEEIEIPMPDQIIPE